MYAQQANTGIAPLDAVLATAQMITPDGGNTVAAQVAQAAAQKMQPQGIMGGMPQARQDFRTAAEIDNMKRMQMQQAMQQMAAQMTARPAGIEGLPAQNMQTFSAAQGGVVGFANEGYVDTKLMRMTPEEYERKRREAMLRGPAPERIRRTPEEEVIFRSLSEPPPMQDIPVPEVVSAQFVAPEAQRLMDRQRSPAPRPPAPATRPPAAAPVPTGIAAALAERPQYDVASIPAAGAPYMKAGEEEVARLRTAEGARAAFEKTLPDLSAKGIEALQQRMRDVEAADAARKERLGLDRVVQQLLGGMQGAGGAARADIQFMNAQNAAADAFSQARLGNQQAQLLLEKAQQERQLGRFDRAIALEKEAAARMEKARDNALKAQQIQQGVASAQFQGAVQMYEGAQNRANAMEVERMRRATADRPGETERIFNRFNELKAKDPAAAEAYLQDIERIKGAGRGLEDKAEFAKLRQQATMLQNELKSAMEVDPLGKSQRVADLRVRLDGIYKQLGGEAAPTGRTMTMADVQATAKASGKTVDEVRKAATAAGYTIQ